MKKGKELDKSIGSKSLSEVARAIRQTASRKATDPDEVLVELFKASGGARRKK